MLAKFIGDNGLSIADDLDGDPVYLARNDFYLGYTRDRSPGIAFTDVKDRHAEGKAAKRRLVLLGHVCLAKFPASREKNRKFLRFYSCLPAPSAF